MEIGTGKNSIPDAVVVKNPVTMEFTGATTYDTASVTSDQATPTASSVAASLFSPAVGGVIGAWLMMWSFLA